MNAKAALVRAGVGVVILAASFAGFQASTRSRRVEVSLVFPDGDGQLRPFSATVFENGKERTWASKVLTVHRLELSTDASTEVEVTVPSLGLHRIRSPIIVQYRDQMIVISKDLRRALVPPDVAMSPKIIEVPSEYCRDSVQVKWVSITRADSVAADRVIAVDSKCEVRISNMHLSGVFTVVLMVDGVPRLAGLARLQPNPVGIDVERVRPAFQELR